MPCESKARLSGPLTQASPGEPGTLPSTLWAQKGGKQLMVVAPSCPPSSWFAASWWPPTVVQECFFFLVISFLPLVLILFLQDYGRHSTPLLSSEKRSALNSISKAISCSPLMLQLSCRLPLFRSLGQSFQSPSFCVCSFLGKSHFLFVFHLTRSPTQVSATAFNCLPDFHLLFRPLCPKSHSSCPQTLLARRDS